MRQNNECYCAYACVCVNEKRDSKAREWIQFMKYISQVCTLESGGIITEECSSCCDCEHTNCPSLTHATHRSVNRHVLFHLIGFCSCSSLLKYGWRGNTKQMNYIRSSPFKPLRDFTWRCNCAWTLMSLTTCSCYLQQY